MMPLYAIRRRVPGATQTDLDAAAFRSINCLPWYDGLRWVRSFHDADAGELLCYYEARDPEQIRLHSERASIPCDEIIEVTELLPDRFVHA